jgi:hypothetical protein
MIGTTWAFHSRKFSLVSFSETGWLRLAGGFDIVT